VPVQSDLAGRDAGDRAQHQQLQHQNDGAKEQRCDGEVRNQGDGNRDERRPWNLPGFGRLWPNRLDEIKRSIANGFIERDAHGEQNPTDDDGEECQPQAAGAQAVDRASKHTRPEQETPGIPEGMCGKSGRDWRFLRHNAPGR
jgi:hypothetical protein